MEKKPEHPNIILILSDDQGSWATGASGNKEIETPSIDRLAGSGVCFENFFCSSPVCSPARATLLTGSIPSRHGVLDWIRAGNNETEGKLIEYLSGRQGYTDYLREAGYECGISGKWHLGDAHHAQKNFSFWSVYASGGGTYYDAPMISGGKILKEKRYLTDAITQNALKWLEEQKNSSKPFYLSVHYTAPHSPWERNEHPVDIYDRYYNGCPFDSVPRELSPPEWVERLSIPVEDEKTRRSHLSGYYAAVTAMDKNIGSILEWLDENKLRENTLVVFTSDNGMNMGHHGVFGKGNATFPMNMFEESVRVPFIASHPGVIEQAVSENMLASQYDFMPTLLEYAGVDYKPSGDQLPGMSFSGGLKGESGKGEREALFVFDEYGPVRMARTKEWKLVRRYPYGPDELYNLKNDPYEKENLSGKKEFRSKEKMMSQRLYEWFLKYADPEKDGCKEAAAGGGQLGLCGLRSKGAKNFMAF